jgi:NAD(P)-dependent dehydrogenase (short-subunit alcohol dehydrogenase family)
MNPEDLTRCTEALEAIAADLRLLDRLPEEARIRLLLAAGRVVRPDKHEVRKRLKAFRSAKRRDREEKDRLLRAATAIRTARRDSVYVPPMRQLGHDTGSVSELELERPRDCYVCKRPFTRVHFFYDSMCAPCASFNYEKRFQTAPLPGRVAVITGARLKIGYQAALMLLRAGARVIVTTRFPHDAALRYAREKDYAAWAGRLQVHGLDLRHSPSVEAFAAHLERTLDGLDILINNAAQTVRRPPGFYRHLMEIETRPVAELPAEARELLREREELKRLLGGTGETRALTDRAAPGLGITSSAELSQIPYAGEAAANEYFPAGRLDADLQQVDHRHANSWRMKLADVPTAEMLEVHLVNAVAPFILCSKLKPLMLRRRTGEKHIVNVSAMEGKFSRHTKTDRHPHTNMAKAALNMMTLTSARDYAKDGIFMNAVDTGWVTDEDPRDLSERKEMNHDFQPPLDIVDGAARVCDPIFSGVLTGQHSWGNFLKDYRPTEW